MLEKLDSFSFGGTKCRFLCFSSFTSLVLANMASECTQNKLSHALKIAYDHAELLETNTIAELLECNKTNII